MNPADEAKKLVYGDRNADYGNPRDDYLKTAKVWSGLLFHKLKPGIEITPEEAMVMMAGLKLSREMNRHKQDNLTDAIGYVLCIDWATNGKPSE